MTRVNYKSIVRISVELFVSVEQYREIFPLDLGKLTFRGKKNLIIPSELNNLLYRGKNILYIVILLS